MISRKMFQIWQVLLAHPNSWVSIHNISKTTQLTYRQITTLVNQISDDRVKKDMTARGAPQYLFRGTPDEADTLLKELKFDLYDVKPHEVDLIYETLTSAGWSTAYDIAEDTGMPFVRVTRIMSALSDVHITDTGSYRTYRRKT